MMERLSAGIELRPNGDTPRRWHGPTFGDRRPPAPADGWYAASRPLGPVSSPPPAEETDRLEQYAFQFGRCYDAYLADGTGLGCLLVHGGVAASSP